MQHLFFSSSNDIFSNGLSFQQWHRQLRQTTKSVLREATWYFQMIFCGIEINKPLSLEILFFGWYFEWRVCQMLIWAFCNGESKWDEEATQSFFFCHLCGGGDLMDTKTRLKYRRKKRLKWIETSTSRVIGFGCGIVSTEWQYTNFDWHQYQDFFSHSKFSETETETFFRDQIFPKPKPRLFFRDQIFRNRNPQKFGKSLETET